ncbi:MAG TPA: mechanosensitive ion channel domain-containing protein [Thermoanaerobaculia bacterium]|nr:mechanosensitive ion channel domain-containing protein [Thermoanaerobaculia bacterium]
MKTAIALLGGVAVLALLLVLIAALRRRSFLVRQLTFPLLVAATAAALETFSLLNPSYPGLPAALSWTLLFFGFAVVLRLLALFLFDVHLLGQRGVRLPPLLPAVAMALVYLITALVTLKVSFPAFDVGPLLATSAVTSLVLGLALQPILANFFAGLVISVEKPFRINDWIKVGDHEGRVAAITWRTTHLRTRENDNLVIPNAKLADERIHNYYYPHPMHLERIRVAVHYKAPPYRVRRILADCAAGVAGTLDKPTPEVYLLSFEESAVVYELRAWIEDVAHSPRIASDLRARIWEEFQKAGIVIPHAIRTLEIAPRPPLRRPPAARGADRETGEGGETATPIPPYAARLYVAEGPERGSTLALDGRPVIVGRSRACALPLTDANASKEHLRIAWEDGCYVLADLGSSFGTRLNGRSASREPLAPLDRIFIGDTVMIFERDEP